MRNDPEFLSTLRETNTQCPRCLLARQTALSEGRCLIRTGGWGGGGVGTTHIRLSHESSVPRRPTPKPGLLSALCVLKAGFDRNLCACGRICSSYACLEHVNESYLILTLWQKEEKNSHVPQSKRPRERPRYRNRVKKRSPSALSPSLGSPAVGPGGDGGRRLSSTRGPRRRSPHLNN